MPLARARIVWVIVACLAWQYGVMNEHRALGHLSLAALVIVMASFAVGLGAVLVALSDRAQKWLDGWALFGVFTFFFVAYGVVDTVARSRSPYLITTDGHAFLDYAARILSRGQNPYDTSLYGAMVGARVPIELQTPLDNGGLSDRLAYPPLSFLWLVPFVKLGIPTTFSYALASYACFAILYKVAPRELRPLVLLPFFAEEGYVAFPFGGLTDTVWALFLCLVVVSWRRPKLAALFFGLACAYKQHPWLVAPFLAVRIARETPPGARLRAIASFLGIAAGTFALVNLPFAIWSPRAWLLGIIEPLASSMVPIGEGLSGLLVYAGASVPKVFFSLAFWGVMLVLLAVTATWRAGRVLVWMAPSIAFFFNYRSLSSYWYFNLLPFVVELALWQGADAHADPRDAPPLLRIRWGLARPVLAALALLVVAAATFASLRIGARLEVVLVEPIRTWGSLAYRVDLTLKNHGSSTITPRFWMHGLGQQPLPWRADGPSELAPGATGRYSIDAISFASKFDIAYGARLTISDLSSSLRSSVVFEIDEGELSPSAVPNGKLRFWDVFAGAPTHWSLGQQGSPGASAAPLPGQPHHAVQLSLEPDAAKRAAEVNGACVHVPSCYAVVALGSGPADVDATDHRVSLGTDFVAREGTLAFWTYTPREANVLPALRDRYGVRLSFEDRAVTLLFGGEASAGTLPDGSPYEILVGPREAWTLHTIDLGALARRFAPGVAPRSGPIERYPGLDIPRVIVRLTLFYASLDSAAKTALFGEIEQPNAVGREDEDRVIAGMDSHPGAVDAWRAHYEWTLKNPTRSNEYLARARRHESSVDLELQAGFQALALNDAVAAEGIFAKVVPLAPVEARLGLGFAASRQGHGEAARAQFEQALVTISEADRGRETPETLRQRASATVGLADAQAILGDCEATRKTLEKMPPAERDGHVRNMPALARCY